MIIPKVKSIEYVETVNGRLRGYKSENIYHFLGVQYGECSRWQRAKMVSPWKGTKNAVSFGNRAFPSSKFTPYDSCGVPHELYAYSEDCLNLNIWTPSIDPEGKKPVMVWIHGGGYSAGSAMEMQAHDGANLALFGDTVVVGINHRLNIFGFCDVSRFGDKFAGSGNLGLSDIVLALRWIHLNIRSFGGDPDNIMLFGQSGGGGKIRCLLQTPDADGLFHKAVIMSGAWGSEVTGNSEDNSYSVRMIDGLLRKYGSNDIETLLDLSPEVLLDSAAEVDKAITVAGMNALKWRPIAGDYYIGNAFSVGIREHALHIPVMIGCTFAEMPALRIRNKHELNTEEQTAVLRECFPNQDLDAVIEAFSDAWPGKCLTDIIETESFLGRKGVTDYADLRVSSGADRTYVYVFAHEFPQDGGRSAWHCSDIPVVFRNSKEYPVDFHRGLENGLEDQLSASYVSFAKTGDPNNGYLGTEWPLYQAGNCAAMIFDDELRVGFDFDRRYTKLRHELKLEMVEKYKNRIVIN